MNKLRVEIIDKKMIVEFNVVKERDTFKENVYISRIICTNPKCDYQYFRPFSCKVFYFCPSCTKKKGPLFGEYLSNELLLRVNP